jgi:hypothetical protein
MFRPLDVIFACLMVTGSASVCCIIKQRGVHDIARSRDVKLTRIVAKKSSSRWFLKLKPDIGFRFVPKMHTWEEMG